MIYLHIKVELNMDDEQELKEIRARFERRL
jgi:hypothetical protein